MKISEVEEEDVYEMAIWHVLREDIRLEDIDRDLAQQLVADYLGYGINKTSSG